jgi:hypothetical protein
VVVRPEQGPLPFDGALAVSAVFARRIAGHREDPLPRRLTVRAGRQVAVVQIERSD